MQAVPHSLEIEQAVLACALLDPALARRAVEEVQEADFYADRHRLIWSGMARALGAGGKVDLVTVVAALEGMGSIADAGGPAYVATLGSEFMPDPGAFDSYLANLREWRLRRELIAASQRLIRAANSEDAPANVLAAAASHLRDLERHVATDGPRAITELVGEGLRTLEKRKAGEAWGLATGLSDLDRLTHGFDPGALVVIAGRPGDGKTSLGLKVASHAALELEVGTLVSSLEMSAQENVFRILSARTEIAYSEIRGGFLREMQRQELQRAARKMHGLPLWIDATATVTATEITTRARRLHREHGLGLVVIDYLQLMPGSGQANRNLELAAITRSLKLLAKELALPVVVLSQLSRKPDEERRRPRLSDLRDSGAIEQDADVVIFPYRPHKNTEDPNDERKAELIVAKQRNGPTAAVPVAWHPETMSFRNAAR